MYRGPGGLLWMGAAGGREGGRGLGAGWFRRGPGVSWASQPAAGVSGAGEPRLRRIFARA